MSSIKGVKSLGIPTITLNGNGQRAANPSASVSVIGSGKIARLRPILIEGAHVEIEQDGVKVQSPTQTHSHTAAEMLSPEEIEAWRDPGYFIS
jgi:hypothetical protein